MEALDCVGHVALERDESALVATYPRSVHEDRTEALNRAEPELEAPDGRL